MEEQSVLQESSGVVEDGWEGKKEKRIWEVLGMGRPLFVQKSGLRPARLPSLRIAT